jgi:protein-L-isoaspartate O-methyltransferase
VEAEALIAGLRARLLDEIDPPPDWRAAYERVPRHVFVPRIIGCSPAEEDQGTDGFVLDAVHEPERWLELVYSDRVLIVVDEQEPERYSSSSRPSVMARFLLLLDVREGNRVLEIGTGTGYNAALLCERLGSDKVTTIDIDVELVEDSRATLLSCGYAPTVVAGDGYFGYPPGAPYDRIIATCAVPRIPPAWREQLAIDGLLVVPLHNNLLVGLRRMADGRLEGRCDRWGAAFMELRSSTTVRHPANDAPATSGAVDRRTIERPPDWMPSRYVRFYAGLISPGLQFSGGDEVDWRLTAGDGSWATVIAEAEGGDYVVSHAGPRRLWDEYEAAAQEWVSLGRPRWDRFGVTVLSGDEQFVWLDSPGSDHRWDL